MKRRGSEVSGTDSAQAARASKGLPVSDKPAASLGRCPICNGDDQQMPCAYPSEFPKGCLRVKV